MVAWSFDTSKGCAPAARAQVASDRGRYCCRRDGVILRQQRQHTRNSPPAGPAPRTTWHRAEECADTISSSAVPSGSRFSKTCAPRGQMKRPARTGNCARAATPPAAPATGRRTRRSSRPPHDRTSPWGEHRPTRATGSLGAPGGLAGGGVVGSQPVTATVSPSPCTSCSSLATEQPPGAVSASRMKLTLTLHTEQPAHA